MSQGRKEICLAAQITGRALSPLTAQLLFLSHVPWPVSVPTPMPPPTPPLYPVASPGLRLFTPVPVAVPPLSAPGHGDRPLHCSGPGKLWGGTQGCFCPCSVAQPWQCLLMQLLGFSLASPAAPGAKHNTSPSCRLSAVPAAFCIQPLAEAALLLHRSSWGTPSGFYSPSPAAGSPNTTLLRLRHVWGWHSLAAPQGAAVGGHTSQQ